MAWWEKVPRAAQAWIVVGSVFVALLSGAYGLGAGASQDLPRRMTAAESRLSSHDSTLVRLQRVDSVSQRNRAVLDTVSEYVAEIRCIMRAEVEGANAARCLQTYGGR